MRLTVIQTQTKRKRLDRPVRRTEKQGRRASTARSRGSIRPIRIVSATADTARGKKHLIGWPRCPILRSNGKPLGECRLNTVGNDCLLDLPYCGVTSFRTPINVLV